MHRITQAIRQMIDQHVDADVRPGGERMRERPGDAEGERVAGELGGRLRGEAEEAPRDHVEGDEGGAEDEPPPRHVAHDGADERDGAAAVRGRGDQAAEHGIALVTSRI